MERKKENWAIFETQKEEDKREMSHETKMDAKKGLGEQWDGSSFYFYVGRDV